MLLRGVQCSLRRTPTQLHTGRLGLVNMPQQQVQLYRHTQPPWSIGILRSLADKDKRSTNYFQMPEDMKHGEVRELFKKSGAYPILALPWISGIGLAVLMALAGYTYIYGRYDSAFVRLHERTKKDGFELVDVAADGDCQYRAIAVNLFGDESKHLEVRRQLVDWLKDNADFPVDDSGGKLKDFMEPKYKNWDNYVLSQKARHAWGDQITLFAAAQVYNRDVWVLSTTEGEDYWTHFKPLKKPSEGSIYLAFDTFAEHYSALVKKELD